MTQRPLSALSLDCDCITMANLRLLDLIALLYSLTFLSLRYSQIKHSPDFFLRLWLFLFSLLLRFILPFFIHWLDLLAVQGTLKSLLHHHSSKASILWHSTFFKVQLSHPYMTTGKTIALTRRTFVGKVMSLLFNMLSRLVITW